MSLLFAAILVTAPTPAVEQVDAAFEDLAASRNAEAIARIEGGRETETDHPATMINLGIAYAREGQQARARALFERAANMGMRVELETAGGSWVDSRALAVRALAALDSGRLGGVTRTATR